MDANGDGALTVDEVADRYDASVHPDVVSGAHSKNEILQNFLANFDGTLGPKSAIVTKEKLLAYYANVSAAIDDDEYFELMVRNVWHLPGGEGAGEGTTARRLLVTHEDGTQTVEALDGDMEVGRDDLRVRPLLWLFFLGALVHCMWCQVVCRKLRYSVHHWIRYWSTLQSVVDACLGCCM